MKLIHNPLMTQKNITPNPSLTLPLTPTTSFHHSYLLKPIYHSGLSNSLQEPRLLFTTTNHGHYDIIHQQQLLLTTTFHHSPTTSHGYTIHRKNPSYTSAPLSVSTLGTLPNFDSPDCSSLRIQPTGPFS